MTQEKWSWKPSWKGLIVAVFTILLIVLMGSVFGSNDNRAAQKEKTVTEVSKSEIVSRARASSVVIRTDKIKASGFFVAPKLLVTNYHVIKDAKKIKVRPTHSLEKIEIDEILGFDKSLDLVLLKTKEPSADFLQPGLNAQPKIGDTVFTYGAPKGIEGTFSSGILSNIRPRKGALAYQITAPFSAGSSGGPVLDQFGQVLGIATAIVKGAQNLNVVIPIKNIASLVPAREIDLLGSGLMNQVCEVSSQVRLSKKHFQRVKDRDLDRLGLSQRCDAFANGCSSIYIGRLAEGTILLFSGSFAGLGLSNEGSEFEHRIFMANQVGRSEVIGRFEEKTSSLKKSKVWRVSNQFDKKTLVEARLKYTLENYCSVSFGLEFVGHRNKAKKRVLKSAGALVNSLSKQIERRLPVQQKSTIDIESLAQLSDTYFDWSKMNDELPAGREAGRISSER